MAKLRTVEMEIEELEKVGEMHKHPEKMADAERYIIYYTFGDETEENEECEDV